MYSANAPPLRMTVPYRVQHLIGFVNLFIHFEINLGENLDFLSETISIRSPLIARCTVWCNSR